MQAVAASKRLLHIYSHWLTIRIVDAEERAERKRGKAMQGRISILLATSVSLAALAPAAAQTIGAATGGSTAGSPTSAEAQNDAGLEEIIVTAQRRPENIQDVSIAIQAITAQGLARSGIQDVSRLELISPGVVFARYGPDAKISLRGANSNNTFLDASPSVGVFVDGVYRPRASQQTRAFFDVSRLEILKGPQGTLYGRNTLAGAVNLYTNAPDVRAFGVGATISYARFNTLRSEGYVNVPFSDTVAVRLAGLFERGDGYIKNLAGENLGNPDTVNVRGSIRYAAPGGGDLTLRVTNIRERGNQTGLFAASGVCRNVTAQGLTDPYGTIKDCRNPRRGSLGTNSSFSTLGRRTVSKDFVHDDKIDEFNATLEGNAPVTDTVNAKAIVSYTNFKLDLAQDSDFSEARVAADFLRENVESYTSELQFNTDFKGPLNLTAGAYFSKDKIKFLSGAIRFSRDTNNATTRPLVAPPGFPTTLLSIQNPTPLASTVIDVGNPAIAGQGGQSSNNFQYLDVKSLGLFGQARFSITDSLRVIGGIRYSRDDKSSINYGGARSSTTYQGPQFPTSIPLTPDGFSTAKSLATSTTSRDYSNVTWRAAVEFDVNPDVLLFAQVATGFLSGSLATADNNVPGTGDTTDDQKSINYEAGIKSRFLDNRVQFNASVYYTKYKNLITSFQRPNSSGGVDTISINGGDIKSKGAEATIELRPIQPLHLTVGLSYLDSEFGTYAVLAPHQLVNGNPSNSGRFINLSGVTPQYAPKFQGSVVAAYDIDLGSAGKITPQVQLYYTSRYSAQTQLSFIDSAGNQPSYSKTDLRLSYTTADERFGIEAFVENLENKVVLQRVTYGGDGIEQAVFGYPRNYGVRLRARF